MENKNVAIIGLGWLGMPLAFNFKNAGFDVYAGSGKSQKIKELNDFGFKGFLISYSDESVQIDLKKNEIDNICHLIICLPPSTFKNYALTISSIVKQFDQKTKIIFTGTTSIYHDNDAKINEDFSKNKEHPVYIAEQNLLRLRKERLTILRLAGLVGGNRHPVKYFIQKDLIPNSNAPVNLVSQKDVIRAIQLIIERNIFGEVFNIVNPFHPTKRDYYLAAAKEIFKTVPRTEVGKGGKLVLGTKFENQVGFQYLFALDDWSDFF
jgi:nucleoside-diphosphate-sugar epimerase